MGRKIKKSCDDRLWSLNPLINRPEAHLRLSANNGAIEAQDGRANQC